ncbi:MAG: WecB/TagA/CpsF family glycosyltransferase [Anaerolineae bacterium]|nr:WecB/TagA/CpsF family glycosyltransferase [Anaerolineae bacterium]
MLDQCPLSAERKLERLPVGDVWVTPLTQTDLHALIHEAVRTRRTWRVLNVNARAVALARRNLAFRQVLQQADVVFCDGYGVLFAARALGYHLPERITYADWIYPFAEFSSSHGLSWFLLGARPGIADRAAQVLSQRYPGLRIVGTHHGYFDREGEANRAVIAQINACQPDVTFVAFGMPHQELWIHRHAPELDTRVLLAAGACFDYVAGVVRRGPRWMTDHGLEWLARILIEPRRLFWRYLVDNTQFAWIVFKQWMSQTRKRSSRQVGW